MPALQRYLIEPIWEQFCALLPERRGTNHPLGCHRSRVSDKTGRKNVLTHCGYRVAD